MENTTDKQPAKKIKKNPLLAQASAAASHTYVAPAAAPSEPRRSGRVQQTTQRTSESKKKLNPAEKKQIENDEEVARRLEEEQENQLRTNNGNYALSLSLNSGSEAQQNPDLVVAQALLGLRNGWIIVGEGDLRMNSNPSESTMSGDPRKIQQIRHTQHTQHTQQTQNAQKRGKNAPKKTIGDRPLAAGIDRTNAVPGVIDRSKLKIRFNTERDDPEREGRVIPGNPVEYDYLENHAEPDWNNAAEVRTLNTWRRQIFGRNFPPIRKTRELWLQSEKDLILKLMREQFEQRGFMQWNRVSNRYNRQMHLANVVQGRGQEFIKHGHRNTSVLGEDRQAPFRSKQAIMGQSIKWPEYGDLVASFQPSASDGDENGQDNDNPPRLCSDDEEEILDPQPGPRPDVIGWRAKAKARSSLSKTSNTNTPSNTSSKAVPKITLKIKSSPSKTTTSMADTAGSNVTTRSGGKRTRLYVEEEEKEELELSSDDSEEDIPAEVPPSKRAKKRGSNKGSRKRGDKDDEPMFPGLK